MSRLWLPRLLPGLGVRNVLRCRMGCRLRRRCPALLLRRLGSRRLRRVRLRRTASLMRLWPGLWLRGDALGIVHVRGLWIWSLLWCPLTGVPSIIGMLRLLRLMRVLRLLGLLEGNELLLLLDTLGLARWHLLLKVHL